jgi:YD repeat-containing protein
LHDLGYVEGKNVVIEWRWAENVNQLSELADQLVHMDVDLIFASSSTEVEAARQATRTIPIVFAVHADPIGVGHVASLSRPGGNITGFRYAQSGLLAEERISDDDSNRTQGHHGLPGGRAAGAVL